MYFKKGFTLVEIVVVTAIIGLIGVAVADFEKNVVSYNKTLYDSLSAEQDGKAAMNVMSTEIKSMNMSANGAYPLAEASTTALTFYTDMNGDGLKELVRYYLSTTSTGILMKQVIKPSGNPAVYIQASSTFIQVAHDIKNATSTPIFTYYSSSYDGATTTSLSFPINPQQVRLIKVTLVIEHDPNKSPVPATYTTQISIRNLKDNL